MSNMYNFTVVQKKGEESYLSDSRIHGMTDLKTRIALSFFSAIYTLHIKDWVGVDFLNQMSVKKREEETAFVLIHVYRPKY